MSTILTGNESNLIARLVGTVPASREEDAGIGKMFYGKAGKTKYLSPCLCGHL